MKKTTHILGALVISAVVAFGSISCNQSKAGKSDTPSVNNTQVVKECCKECCFHSLAIMNSGHTSWSGAYVNCV